MNTRTRSMLLPSGLLLAICSVMSLLAGCSDDPVVDQGTDTQPDVVSEDVASDTEAADTESDTSDPADVADDAAQEDSATADDTTDGGIAEDIRAQVTNGKACDEGTRVGKFEVAHWGFYAAITGEVADGIIPLTVLQEVASDGNCRLMQKTNPFCNPPCSAGELCDHDSTCIAYPSNLSVGDVTIDGLNAAVTMAPNSVDTYSTTDVPLPLFDEVGAVSLSAAGGDDVAAFEMSAFGVPDLVVPQTEIELARDEPLTVTWEPEPADWQVTVAVNIDQHGNSPVTLVCETSENSGAGSLTVSASLINQLLDFGVSGFASYDLQRLTTDAVELWPGCVELRVFSHATGRLKVAGHVACNAEPDCPDGYTCQVAINTCVPE